MNDDDDHAADDDRSGVSSQRNARNELTQPPAMEPSCPLSN